MSNLSNGVFLRTFRLFFSVFRVIFRALRALSYPSKFPQRFIKDINILKNAVDQEKKDTSALKFDTEPPKKDRYALKFDKKDKTPQTGR